MSNNELKWNEQGLIPVIVQDWLTGQVLMLAYANAQALAKTIETGQAHYWSRSRQELWHKGATSGHVQLVKEIRYDCDADVLLFLVEQIGAACHTGERSCFYRTLYKADGREAPEQGLSAIPPAAAPPSYTQGTLDALFALISHRRLHPKEGSYTCRLLAQGKEEIAKKVGEEAIEVVLASAGQGKERLIAEVADLVYHLLVLLAAHDLHLGDLYRELEARRK